MTTIQCVLILSAPVPVPKRVCVKSDSRISSQGWWVSRVAVRNLWPQAVDESFLLSSSRNAHSNWTYTVLNWWVLRDIGEKWCEEWYNIPVIHDLTELNEHLAVEIPSSAQVYPSVDMLLRFRLWSCASTVTVLRRWLKELIRLDVSLKVKSEIEMVPEVWVISWGEVCLTSHKWFRICSDITQMVQNLWIKNQRFILPLESFYLSKSTVSPIITLLKCQSTWICSHWIVYSSNYWEGDNNQEYIEHSSR
jgi:hypothetical protein